MRLRFLIVLAAAAAGAWYGYQQLGDRKAPTSSSQPGEAAEPKRPSTSAERPAQERVSSARRGEPAPARSIELSLITASAQHYMPERAETEADRTYRRLVRDLGRSDIRYDVHLARAAGEFAAQAAAHGKPPPSAAISFLLHAAGAPDYNAAQFYLSTTNEGRSALERAVTSALKQSPGGEGDIIVGVGEAATPGDKYARRVAVLVTRRSYTIDRVSRRASVGSKWTLQGLLPAGYENPSAHILYPDGSIGTARVDVDGHRFTTVVPTGKKPGTMFVGIDGVGRNGPGKLLQLSVEVGRAPPSSKRFAIAGPEGPFRTLAEAEAFALRLLNTDRTNFGLPALAHDPALSAIARAHSNDMRDNRFFGHHSPTTGLAGKRLEAAGYRSISHAENLAQNDSLTAAEASLMGSVGHRANILGAGFTVAGVGLAMRKKGKATEWFVTQLFAKPVSAVEPDRVASDLLATINQQRQAAGDKALSFDASLSAAAQRGADRASRGSLDGLARSVLDDARRHLPRGGSVSAQTLYDLAKLAAPPLSLESKWRRVGIGVAQSETDLHGRIGLVVLVGK